MKMHTKYTSSCWKFNWWQSAWYTYEMWNNLTFLVEMNLMNLSLLARPTLCSWSAVIKVLSGNSMNYKHALWEQSLLYTNKWLLTGIYIFKWKIFTTNGERKVKSKNRQNKQQKQLWRFTCAGLKLNVCQVVNIGTHNTIIPYQKSQHAASKIKCTY